MDSPARRTYRQRISSSSVWPNQVSPTIHSAPWSLLPMFKRIPGLNTLGVSMSRIDYAPGGLNPPHTHPRATEMVFVLEGQLDVGFITTANVLISKTIKVGETFVFPKGLVHFQKNNGQVPAAVIAAFNSQLPGTQSIAATLFSAQPPVPDHVLTMAFQVGTKEVRKIKSRFAPKK
ncbi:GERMIN-LIKE PROTEIN SUBFAMILY 3 MEMBER 3 [Salix purpurea]|uniref:Germin-like protein n=1 Tax=Salix purpurea TaxID=77065 RepID=A0A9Q0WZ05_SALPP|nr:GERMIN-LIKE PROTEIN SUBFAMILY 3 MEMBER 3 [Salix purpurea]